MGPDVTPAAFELHAVAAMAANRVIGRDGKLPWRLPNDLRFFQNLTCGHPVVMGRRTYESIGRPLKGRRNIVLSRSLVPSPGVEIIQGPGSLWDLDLSGSVFVIGGEAIYRELLPQCSSVYLSRLFAAFAGDTWLPPFEQDFPLVEKLATFPEFELLHYRRKPNA
ncbi:MAG: dihydrofolate reductase [Verrucomicrobiales bacterium]